MKLLYYSPSSYGGLADYAHEQANALSQFGVDVVLLCPPKYLETRTPTYKTISTLRENRPDWPSSNQLVKAAYFICNTLFNFSTLIDTIKSGSFSSVLFGSYTEYLAPLWAGSLRRLAKQGVRFGAVVHDPVRDFVLGPVWWHRRSIVAGYSFLSDAFVHEATVLDTVVPMPNLRTTVIPHGPYRFAEPTESAEDTRLRLHLPKTAKVMLAFGHIRANKNLDLAIRAMAKVEDVYLLVAGKELTAGQSLVKQYQHLAKTLGVSDRIRWEIRFICETDMANFFQASDQILLTYDHTFHSASGVLNAAAGYRKPCLASAGAGTLQSVVKKYQLGTWIEPNAVLPIAEAMKLSPAQRPKPDWEGFLRDNAWQKNAEIVMDKFFSKVNQSSL